MKPALIFTLVLLSSSMATPLECEWRWEVVMPDGAQLYFWGQEVEDAFRIEDGYTKIIVLYKDFNEGRSCCAPGIKWFFLSSFDGGNTNNWTKTVQ